MAGRGGVAPRRSGYALQGQPGCRARRRTAPTTRDVVAAHPGAPRLLRPFQPPRVAAACRSARAPGQARRAVGILQNAVGRIPETRSLDRARQRAGRSCARDDAAGRACLRACGAKSRRSSRPALLLRSGFGALGRSGGASSSGASLLAKRAGRRRAGGRSSSRAWLRSARRRARAPREAATARTAGRALRRPPGAGSCRPRR